MHRHAGGRRSQDLVAGKWAWLHFTCKGVTPSVVVHKCETSPGLRAACDGARSPTESPGHAPYGLGATGDFQKLKMKSSAIRCRVRAGQRPGRDLLRVHGYGTAHPRACDRRCEGPVASLFAANWAGPTRSHEAREPKLEAIASARSQVDASHSATPVAAYRATSSHGKRGADPGRAGSIGNVPSSTPR